MVAWKISRGSERSLDAAELFTLKPTAHFDQLPLGLELFERLDGVPVATFSVSLEHQLVGAQFSGLLALLCQALSYLFATGRTCARAVTEQSGRENR